MIFALDATNSPTLIRPNNFETLTTLSEPKHASFGVALRRYEGQIYERKLTKRMLMKILTLLQVQIDLDWEFSCIIDVLP